MLPTTEPSFFTSTRSSANRLPRTFPYTITSRACTSETISPEEPTVRRWPFKAIGPSTFPSICKSSSPEIWPFTVKPGPRTAAFFAAGAVERVGAAVEGDELKLEAAGAAGYVVAGWAGAGAGYSFCLLLFHMIPPKWLPEICTGIYIGRRTNVGAALWTSQSQFPFRFPLINWPEGQGGETRSARPLQLRAQFAFQFSNSLRGR